MCSHDLAELHGAGLFSWRGSSWKGEGCSLATQLKQLTFPVVGVGDADWRCVCRRGQSIAELSWTCTERDNDEIRTVRKKRRSAAEVVPGLGCFLFIVFLSIVKRPWSSLLVRQVAQPPFAACQTRIRSSAAGARNTIPLRHPRLFQAVEIGVAG